MKNHIQNIELVNQYLNNELNNSAREVFNQRLKLDNEFKILFDEQSLFLEGIKRHVLKGEIKQAHRTYKRNNLLKILGVALLVVSLVITFFYLTNKSYQSIAVDKPSEEIFNTSSSDTVIKTTPPVAEAKTIESIVDTIRQNTDTPKQTSTSEILIVPDVQKNKTEIEQLYSSLKKQPEVFQINTAKDTVITCNEGTLLTIKANTFIDSKTNKIIKRDLQLKVTEYYNLSDIITANLTTLADDAILETGGMLYMEASQKTTNCILSNNKSIDIGFPYEQHKKNMQLFTGEKDKEFVNWKLLDDLKLVPIKTEKTVLLKGILKDTLAGRFNSKQNDSNYNFINVKDTKTLDELEPRLGPEAPLKEAPFATLEKLPFPIDSIPVTTDNNLPSINKNDITRYLFNASKLGWINCDRFINSKKTKIKFKVKVGKGTDIDVKMIFKNFKAVLPGKLENENYTFSKVPIDEPVLIYAIKFENGQYYMALHDTTISNKNTSLIFEKVSLPKLKENIKTLDSL